ncbi:hypothetical protein [Zhihengliuella sp.]|uniref:hypothetical protein n=1 Tax=Zhihengliuella sp. TaxID=1954483 RepID=UPI0028121E1E|nr:hypothetical protein [Zhihengliuella sp.]
MILTAALLMLVISLIGVVLFLPPGAALFRRQPTAWAIALIGLLATSGVLAAAGSVDGPGLNFVAAILVSVSAALFGGSHVTEAVFRWASFKGPDGTPHPVGEPSNPGILQGGLWIGLLERVAIAATLWAGWPEGLAVVLAVKGLGRFAELKDHAAAERFILGTFASVLWAAGCYGIGRLLGS